MVSLIFETITSVMRRPIPGSGKIKMEKEWTPTQSDTVGVSQRATRLSD